MVLHQPVELAWFACDLRTGAIAEELPAMRTEQPIGRKIGAATTAQLALALAGAPREWEAATDQVRTLQVAVDTRTGQPIWSGIVLVRDGGAGPEVRLSTITPEGYWDRRYPGDYSATATDASTVMAALAAPLATSGPPITIDAVASGTLIDYTMQDSDDRTVLSAWQEISAMQGGPEWTVDTVWADAAQTKFQLVARIRPALGVQDAQPEAVFDMPGCLADYTLTESYERGRGATSTLARGEQGATDRASSSVHTDAALIAAGWCLWEYRWTPAAGITSTAQLDLHAAEALALMRTGTRAWSLRSTASRAPRVGTDWGLGDSVAVRIDTSPRHPDGASAIARAYAWTLDPAADTLIPILLEDA